MAASCSFGGDFKASRIIFVYFFPPLKPCLNNVFKIEQIWIHSSQVAEKNPMHQSSSGWICHAVGSYKYGFDLL